MFTAAGKSAAASAANYIEDVFSTYLYTGTGASQTINNGVDLSGKGGLVWLKNRTQAANHILTDTERGFNKQLRTNETGGNETNSTLLTSFNNNGFSLGVGNSNTNASPESYTSWTFREQAKFFDVVTYTGNGVDGRTVNHSLGSTPGFIVVKRTDGVSNWVCWHRSINSGTGNGYIFLQTTAAAGNDASGVWGNGVAYVAPTSTQFTVAAGSGANANGASYVAYLFAHDAGGFGATGTDNVISCGSFTADGSGNATVSLGYEPQWVMIKASSTTAPWNMFDVMRGMAVGGSGSNNDNILQANSAGAETASYGCDPSSTGFIANGWSASQTYIYIAIRRGPMKTPTSGTSVFSPSTASGVIQSGFVTDLLLGALRAGTATSPFSYDRLRGGPPYLVTSSTAAEASATSIGFDTNNGVAYNWPSGYVSWFFRRAPGFLDVVCYTGTGSTRTVTHNLGVAPELVIVKPRSSSVYDWNCYHVSLGNTKYIALDTALAASSAVSLWNNTTPTSTVFTVNHPAVNDSGTTYVSYLFATVAGVSKVGGYTGTGTTKQIDCGFTAGARFVMIKRTDSTGDWYVWDTARGIVSGNDPYLLLNSTAAEVTSTDYIDPLNAGFEISSTAPAAINANGGTYIYLAIA